MVMRDACPTGSVMCVTAGSLPVKDAGTGEAFPKCPLASSVPRRNVTSHPTGACRPRSLWLPLLARFLDSAPRRLQAPLRGPQAPQEHALGLPASASSDKKSYKQNPGLCSVTTQPSHRGCSGLSPKTPTPVVPWRVVPGPPPPREQINFVFSRKQPRPSHAPLRLEKAKESLFPWNI